MNPKSFRRIVGRSPQRLAPFAQPIQRPGPPLARAALYHYWHPDRDGVEPCPPDFAAKLLDIGGTDHQGRPMLGCVRPPASAPIRCRCWLVWFRKPEVTHPLSPGWMLMIAWHDGAEPIPTPLPLDNRVLANIHLQSLKSGRSIFGRDFSSAVEYYDHCMKELDRDKQARRDKDRIDLAARSRDFYQSTKIKNIGRGNKFALHHDGTILPSRGEQNWTKDREKYR